MRFLSVSPVEQWAFDLLTPLFLYRQKKHTWGETRMAKGIPFECLNHLLLQYFSKLARRWTRSQRIPSSQYFTWKCLPHPCLNCLQQGSTSITMWTISCQSLAFPRRDPHALHHAVTFGMLCASVRSRDTDRQTEREKEPTRSQMDGIGKLERKKSTINERWQERERERRKLGTT